MTRSTVILDYFLDRVGLLAGSESSRNTWGFFLGFSTIKRRSFRFGDHEGLLIVSGKLFSFRSLDLKEEDCLYEDADSKSMLKKKVGNQVPRHLSGRALQRKSWEEILVAFLLLSACIATTNPILFNCTK